MAPSPAQLDDLRALVLDLARGQENSNDDLPSLSEQAEKGAFWEGIRSPLENVFGASNIEDSSITRWLKTVSDSLVENFHWFVALVAFVGCWILLLKWLQRKSSGWKSIYERPIIVARTESAREGLEIALRRADYAEAARWQWRLLLERRGTDSTLTPSEYTQMVPRSERFDAALPEVYRIMFGPGTASETDFRKFALLLDETFAESPQGVVL
jgi:hypothetical protein